jgi:hypothetical protein
MSDYVASYELTARNEGVLVEDFTLTFSADSSSAISEVVVFDNNMVEIAREVVTDAAAEFTDVDFTVEEGTENIYVKVVARKIGKNEAGTQLTDKTIDFTIVEAEGVSSNNELAADADVADAVEAGDWGYDSNGNGTFDQAADVENSGESLGFAVVPVRVSNIAFVSSYGGVSVASSLNTGENNVAIIALTTDSNPNTDTNGGDLKAQIATVIVNVSKLAGTDATDSTTVSAMSIERVGGADADGQAATAVTSIDGAAETNGAITFDMSSLTNDDDVLENGTTTYFVVKATVAKATAVGIQDYVKVEFTDLANSANGITYASDDAGTSGQANITDARIGVDSLDGTQVSDE